jgi:hypothetical protein
MADLKDAFSQVCSKCLEELPKTSFSKDKSKKTGIHTVCKPCQKKQKDSRKDEAKKVRKAHYEKNKEKSSLYHKEKNSNPKVKSYNKEKHLKKTYNLTLDEVEALKVKQKFRCAICKTHEEDCSRKTLFVDHNHKTGEIRGLLCSQCNSALGLMYDSKEILNNAIEYLNDYTIS